MQLIRLLTLLLALALLGCPSTSVDDDDAGDDDDATGDDDDATGDDDDATGDDDDATAPIIRTAVQVTAGGGSVSGPGYTARVVLGAPQPAGRAASADHTVTVSPAAAP